MAIPSANTPLSRSIQVQTTFNSALLNFQPGQVRGFAAAAPAGVVCLIGTPTVGVAASMINEAIAQATALARAQGNTALADEQAKLLEQALQGAWAKLDAESIDLQDENDPLYEQALERMAKAARGS